MKILITGGASGLGEEMTRRFAQVENNTVFFTYHKSLEKAKDLMRQFPNVSGIPCDFNNKDAIAALVKKIPELDPDLLINNAFQGKFIDKHFQKTSIDEFHQSFRVNILPVISITQASLDAFRKKKSGVLLTILSSALEDEFPVGSSVYMATKGYLEQLTRSWSVENKKFNIISGAVSPSLMITPLTQQLDERLLDQMKEQSPQKRFLGASEAAEIVFQLMKIPSKLNGQNIKIEPDTIIN